MNLETLESIRTRYNSGEVLDFKFFWGGFLSNWHLQDFVVDDVTYNCVEQYMMAMKAKLFKDTDVLFDIMQTNNQREIKCLGRLVKGYDDNMWSAKRLEVVYTGNLAKYSQNSDLQRWLLNTKSSILVEASPQDDIWGIKMGSSDSRIHNPNNWCGTNYLGFILMSVRSELSKEV